MYAQECLPLERPIALLTLWDEKVTATKGGDGITGHQLSGRQTQLQAQLTMLGTERNNLCRPSAQLHHQPPGRVRAD